MTKLGGTNVSEDTDKDASGHLQSVVAGTGIDNIDNTDPVNPVINATVAGGSSGARVRRDANQAIATTYTAVWDSEVYDDNDFIDIGSNADRMTVPTGVTRVNLSAYLRTTSSVSVGSDYSLSIKHYNAADALQETVASVEANTVFTTTQISLAALGIPCVATDYFEVDIFFSDSSVTTDIITATIQDAS